MIEFTDSLTAALRKHAPKSFWALRLYYDDETSFVGISDIDRTLGSNTYYGIANWSPLVNSIDLDNFKVKPTTMDIDIVNTENVLEGGRFSDFFASHEFTNRTWKLYQSDENADWHEDNIIATGLISDQISHNEEYVTIKLRDYDDKWHGEIPVNVVDETTYPNAPEKNIDKPIPIMYGDYQTDNGTYKDNPEFQDGFAPAIIVNKWEDDGSGLTAMADNETIKEISEVFINVDDKYASFVAAATIVEPKVTFTGTTWKVYYRLTAHDTEETGGVLNNYGNAIDGDLSTYLDWTTNDDGNHSLYFRVPEEVKNKLGGSITGVNIKLFGYLTDNGVTSVLLYAGTDGGDFKSVTYSASNDENSDNVEGFYSSTEQETWDLGIDEIRIRLDPADAVLYIYDIGIEIEFTPEKTYTHKHYQEVEIDDRDPSLIGQGYGAGGTRTITSFSRAIGDIDVVYVTGEGRMFGAYIDDGRNNGYNENDVISNPVYIIEDMMRTERSLTTSDINVTNFDAAGSNTGDIENTFGLDDDQILFRFSQNTFKDSKSYIRGICRQAGLYFSFDNEGKADIFARRRSYTQVVKTLDFNLMDIGDISYSRLKDVVNDVYVDYLYDYGSRSNLKKVDYTDDAGLRDTTSQGNTSSGYNKVHKQTINGHFIEDQATAIGIGEAYIIFKKDRKLIIDLKVGTAIYNDLMKGDIVNIDNWDTSIKAMGVTITTSLAFMVTELRKLPNSMRIELTNLPGTIA